MGRTGGSENSSALPISIYLAKVLKISSILLELNPSSFFFFLLFLFFLPLPFLQQSRERQNPPDCLLLLLENLFTKPHH